LTTGNRPTLPQCGNEGNEGNEGKWSVMDYVLVTLNVCSTLEINFNLLVIYSSQ